MRINKIGAYLPQCFSYCQKMTSVLSINIKEFFTSLGNTFQREKTKISSSYSVKLIVPSMRMKTMTLFALATLASSGIESNQSLYPTITIDNLVGQEEVPYKAEWIKTDLFGFNSTNQGPITVFLEQVNGNPIPNGLSFDNIPLTIVRQLPYQLSNGILSLNNNWLVLGEINGGTTPLAVNLKNPQNPFISHAIPTYSIFNSYYQDNYYYENEYFDFECDANQNFCYILQYNTLLSIDFRGGVPALSSITTLSGATSLSIDKTSQTGVVPAVLSNEDYFNQVIYFQLNLQLLNFTTPGSSIITQTIPIQSIVLPKNTFSLPTLVTFDQNICCTIGYNPSNTTLMSQDQGSIYYLASYPHQFMAVNLTDPSNPIIGNITFLNVYVPFKLEKSGNSCLGSYPDGIRIFNVTDVTQTKMISFLNLNELGLSSTGIVSTTIGPGGRYYLLGLNQLTLLDITVFPPLIVSSFNVPVTPYPFSIGPSPRGIANAGNSLYMLGQYGGGLTITSAGDSVQLFGTPKGGTAGTYTFVAKAIDFNRNPVGIPQQFSFQILPAVTAISTIPNLQFVVGIVNTFVFGSIFKHFASAPLSCSLTPLPKSCTFDILSTEFSCLPTPEDVGVKNLTLKGTDSQNAYAEKSFQLTVLYGPIVANKISNYIAEVGIPIQIDTRNTFIDLDNHSFTYIFSAPNWLQYNNQTIFGIGSLEDVGISQVALSEKTSDGLMATSAFQITTQLVAPPQINSLVASAIQNNNAPRGQLFYLAIPKSLFVDPLGRADIQSNYIFSGFVPTFLSLDTQSDPNNFIIQGTPGWGDVGFYENSNNPFLLQACRANLPTICTSNISYVTVSGTTQLLLIIAIASTILGALGAYKYRSLIWNLFRKSNYRKEDETAVIGKPYVLPLSKLGIGSKTARRCAFLFNRIFDLKPVAAHSFIPDENQNCLSDIYKSMQQKSYLSSGIKVLPQANIIYNRPNNELVSSCVTAPEKLKKVTIQVVNKSGRILAEFILNIEVDHNRIMEERSYSISPLHRFNTSISLTPNHDSVSGLTLYEEPNHATLSAPPRLSSRNTGLYHPTRLSEVGIEFTDYLPKGSK